MDTRHTESVDNLLVESTSYSRATISTTRTSTSSSKDLSKANAWLKDNWKSIVEVVIIAGVILLVCGMFSIPTILFILPPIQSNEETSINSSHSCLDDPENSSTTNVCPNTTVTQSSDDITCAVGFYLDNSTGLPACIPLCEDWLYATMADIAFATSLILGMINCIILFYIVKYQKNILYVFPTFYLIYVCMSLLFGAPFLIVGALLKSEVFCSSDSLIETLMNSSPFCIVSGVVNTYVVAQVALLVTFHALGLCWGVAFPFHYRRFKGNGKIKYIHGVTVVFALVLPAIPALLHLIYGYSIAVGPLNVCIVRNIRVSYFTLTLPISVLLAMAASAFVVVFWKLFKEFVLKRFGQTSQLSVTKAEVKIFVIMCYYIIMGTFTLSTYAYHLATDAEIVGVLYLYFACHSIGLQPDRDCGAPPNIRLKEFSTVATVSLILQSLLPLIVFTFIVNFSCCTGKKLSKTLLRSTRNSRTTTDQCVSMS